MPFAPRQVPPGVQCLLRFRVDPLVEAFVADAHMRVGRPFGLQPALDRLGRPALPKRVHDPREQRRIRHAHRLARLTRALLGLALRSHGRVERPRRPRARLQPFRPVGAIGLVLVGRGPQAAPQLAADGGLVAADPQGDLTDPSPSRFLNSSIQQFSRTVIQPSLYKHVQFTIYTAFCTKTLL